LKLEVAQVFNLLYRRISSCRPVGNARSMEVTSDDLQTKSLRYSPADAGRYAFGPAQSFGSDRNIRFRSVKFKSGLDPSSIGLVSHQPPITNHRLL